MMLLMFAVQNFMSFRDKTVLDMRAGQSLSHPDHVAEVNGNRVLKGSFLFGGNAGGKSNFIRAIQFAHDAVIHGLDQVKCDRKYFRIDASYRTRPGVFQFDILAGEQVYSYGFAVSYETASLEEEWLIQHGEEETCIFVRQLGENGAFSVQSQLYDESRNRRLGIYLEDFQSAKTSRRLLLPDVALRAPDGDSNFKAFFDVYQWFSKLHILFPDSGPGSFTGLVSGEKRDYTLFLDAFDTGIEDMVLQKADFGELAAGLPESVSDQLRAELRGRLNGNAHIGISDGTDRYEIWNRDGELSANKMVFDHGNPADLFSFADESEGTKRLIDLIPLFRLALDGGVLLMDEFDRSFHDELTKEFVQCFYEYAKGVNTQVIATVKSSRLIDLDLLMQDEICFVERKGDHSSVLYSLNKYCIRYDKTLIQDYFLGRYGGVPAFSRISSLDPEDEWED